MNILVTNDDGFSARGIYALAKELSKEHNVTVVAPRDQKSACGHSITLFSPLKVREEKLEDLNCRVYSVAGTPADCVRVGIDMVCKDVDMVISGINRGINAGTDVIYSGTVSAAIEAAIYNIPSMAVSQLVDWNRDDEDYELAAEYALRVANMAKEKYFKDDVVLNLNVPKVSKEEIKGFKVCKIGKTTYKHTYEKIESIDLEETYSIGGTRNERSDIDDDIYYLENNYVTLTPLHFDLTNFKILKEVEEVFKL